MVTMTTKVIQLVKPTEEEELGLLNLMDLMQGFKECAFYSLLFLAPLQHGASMKLSFHFSFLI
jgi:hypothetical protein